MIIFAFSDDEPCSAQAAVVALAECQSQGRNPEEGVGGALRGDFWTSVDRALGMERSEAQAGGR